MGKNLQFKHGDIVRIGRGRRAIRLEFRRFRSRWTVAITAPLKDQIRYAKRRRFRGALDRRAHRRIKYPRSKA